MAAKKYPTRVCECGVLVTVEMATKLLARMRFNRPLNRHRVAEYVDIIKNGLWKAIGSPVVIDWDGFIINGQHRLNAIIESGIAVILDITYGDDPANFALYDSKGSVRTSGDQVGMQVGNVRGWTKEQDDVFSARLHAILLLLLNRRPKNASPWFHEFLAGLEWSLQALPGKVGYQQATVAGILAYAHMVEPKLVEDALPGLKKGWFPDPEDPLMALSKRISESGRSVVGAERRPMCVRTLSALYAKLRGLKLRDSKNLEEQAIAYFKDKHDRLQGRQPIVRRKAA